MPTVGWRYRRQLQQRVRLPVHALRRHSLDRLELVACEMAGVPSLGSPATRIVPPPSHLLDCLVADRGRDRETESRGHPLEASSHSRLYLGDSEYFALIILDTPDVRAEKIAGEGHFRSLADAELLFQALKAPEGAVVENQRVVEAAQPELVRSWQAASV